MRKPAPAATLARLVAVLFAAPVIAHAFPAAIAFHIMTNGSTSGGTTNGTVAPTNNTTAAPITAPAPASSSGSSASSSSSGTSLAPTNTTSTDQRAAATSQAVQPERASGNTAASQFQAATASPGAATVSQTTGATSSNGATSTSAGSSGATTTATGGINSVLGFPGSVGTIVNSGEPVVDTNGNIVSASAAYAVTPQVTETTGYAAPQYIGADVAVADNTMNQVIGDAKRDRRRVGRNGQLLYSIAPRTSVDRSAQMPDDGPSPALKGPLSR